MTLHSHTAALQMVVALALAACGSTQPAPPATTAPLRLNDVNAVRREIKAGMEQSAVREALGSPSVVSSDSEHREVWTYEEVASDRVDTSRSVGGSLVVLGPKANAPSTLGDARLLTIIIYYDDAKRVRDLAYNYSSR
jgi:outer membrane protein assembly factor BamE (lipoprotein component of BamABCDE complex)